MSKEKAPAFQFFAADYLCDENVAVMTSSEEGHYIRAIAYCWREGSIPSDVERLKKLLGKSCTNEEARVVQGCFKQDPSGGGRLVHPRLEIERERQAAWRAKSAEGGRKSVEARKNQRLTSFKGGSRVVQPKGNSASTSTSSIYIKNRKFDFSVIPDPKARQAVTAWVEWMEGERGERVSDGTLRQTLKRYWERWPDLVNDIRWSMSQNYNAIKPEWKKNTRGNPKPRLPDVFRKPSSPQKIGNVLAETLGAAMRKEQAKSAKK